MMVKWKDFIYGKMM